MTILYKVTDENHKTLNNTQWGPDVSHGPTSGQGPLCSSGWIHAYKTAKDAALMHKYHVSSFENYVLWEAEGTIEKEGDDLKIGTRTLKTIRIIPFLEITPQDIDMYLDHENWQIRYWAIKRPNANSENIDKALNDEDWEIRYWAIYHPNADEKNIDKAMNDIDWFVREAAIYHPNVTNEQVDKGLKDKDLEVREAAQYKKVKINKQNIKK